MANDMDMPVRQAGNIHLSVTELGFPKNVVQELLHGIVLSVVANFYLYCLI
jgi:hypothetical protein